MALDNIQKTAITTPFRLFEFLRMPFSLKNSAQAFQRLMDGVFRGLEFVFHLDDILVASSKSTTTSDTSLLSSSASPTTVCQSTMRSASSISLQALSWVIKSQLMGLCLSQTRLRQSPLWRCR